LSKRMSQANDDISRSIQVSFQNASAYTSDYFFIINYLPYMIRAPVDVEIVIDFSYPMMK
jgi:hypothetical protein